jgi:hypothetical protein
MSETILANSRLTSYLVDASIDVSYLKAPLNTVNDVAAQTKIELGASALASIWASTLIYCCVESCDTFASALGNAWAYADKAEAVFALLAIAVRSIVSSLSTRSIFSPINLLPFAGLSPLL